MDRDSQLIIEIIESKSPSASEMLIVIKDLEKALNT